MDVRHSFFGCLCGPSQTQSKISHHNIGYTPITEKPRPEPLPFTVSPGQPLAFPYKDDKDDTDDELAALVIKIHTILLTSPIPAPPRTDLMTEVITATDIRVQDWTTYLAERLLHALEGTLKEGEVNLDRRSSWGEALADAYNHAVAFAKQELRELWEYAKAHPYEVAATVLLTVLALGVMVRLVPIFVRVLGFGELGPVEGSFAAWWQRLYAGYVPKGSLWSFLQRMGMTWK
ncbi:hypothetical protein C7999DRAFT_12811 [Corynascus novoguineensis]|uniref:Uncharacterized protein n=1 Tax=Corynascus novoguineensis TaxID=1126955 RepID=A0AAN7HRC5_9PEZI|nr:hypothetical protein C7999DRAFT_12811 [Corynascus novoguineensis]